MVMRKRSTSERISSVKMIDKDLDMNVILMAKWINSLRENQRSWKPLKMMIQLIVCKWWKLIRSMYLAWHIIQTSWINIKRQKTFSANVNHMMSHLFKNWICLSHHNCQLGRSHWSWCDELSIRNLAKSLEVTQSTLDCYVNQYHFLS